MTSTNSIKPLAFSPISDCMSCSLAELADEVSAFLLDSRACAYVLRLIHEYDGRFNPSEAVKQAAICSNLDFLCGSLDDLNICLKHYIGRTISSLSEKTGE